eukprot:g18507.t1
MSTLQGIHLSTALFTPSLNISGRHLGHRATGSTSSTNSKTSKRSPTATRSMRSAGWAQQTLLLRSVAWRQRSSETKAFEYVYGIPVTDRKAGKILAGWNANEAAFAVGFEDLDLFNPHSAKYNKRYDDTMDNIITALFGNPGEHLHYLVQRALTAQWFRHASAYHRAYGDNAPMLEHVLKPFCSFASGGVPQYYKVLGVLVVNCFEIHFLPFLFSSVLIYCC